MLTRVKRSVVSTNARQEMKWQSRDNAHKSRRHSAFVVSSHGKSAGQIVVAPEGGDCACNRSNSEQGMDAERRACGLPRERNGLHGGQLAAVVTMKDGVGGGVSDTFLARNGCRESGVARCPLAVT